MRPKSRPNFNESSNFIMIAACFRTCSHTNCGPPGPLVQSFFDTQAPTIHTFGQRCGKEQNEICNIASLSLSKDRPPLASLEDTFWGSLFERDNRGDATHAPQCSDMWCDRARAFIYRCTPRLMVRHALLHLLEIPSSQEIQSVPAGVSEMAWPTREDIEAPAFAGSAPHYC